jgi:hypothetical protein
LSATNIIVLATDEAGFASTNKENQRFPPSRLRGWSEMCMNLPRTFRAAKVPMWLPLVLTKKCSAVYLLMFGMRNISRTAKHVSGNGGSARQRCPSISRYIIKTHGQMTWSCFFFGRRQSRFTAGQNFEHNCHVNRYKIDLYLCGDKNEGNNSLILTFFEYRKQNVFRQEIQNFARCNPAEN